MRLLFLSLLGLGQTYVRGDLADGVNVTDSVTLTVERFALDNVTVTDTSAQEAVYSRALAETVSATEAILVSVDFSVSRFDTVSIADTSFVATEHVRSPTDTTSVTDVLIRETSFFRTIEDHTLLTDSTSTSLVISIPFFESLIITDVLQVGYERYAHLSDTIAGTDTLSKLFEFERSLVDFPIVIDLVQLSTWYQRELSDSIFVASQALTVEVDDQTDRLVGTPGFFDADIPVCNGDIVFIATLPGVLTKTGVKFTSRVWYAALRRAASTLAHWGMRDGCIIEFMRKAIPMLQEDLAAKLSVSEAVVQAWEANQLEMPRLSFDILAAYVCEIDDRSFGQGFELVRPPSDEQLRHYRIVPAIPKSNKVIVRL